MKETKIIKGIRIIIADPGSLVLLALLLLYRAVYGSFYHTAWFLFFQEIASVKKEEKVEEAEEIIKEKISEASV